MARISAMGTSADITSERTHDALTAAGVWSDDRLANPSQMLVRYDDEGPHRVNIIVTKLYEPAHVRIVDRPKTRKTDETPETPQVAKMRNSAAPAHTRSQRVALVNGKPVPYRDALALIQNQK